MKYNKIVSLLALGTLFGPTLLSSQQAFAEESGVVGSDSATTSSSQQTTESSTPGSTDSSEEPTPEPELPPKEEEYQLVSAETGNVLQENTLFDAYGNKVVFTIPSNQSLTTGTSVNYQVTLVEGYSLKEVRLSNTEKPVTTSMSGTFQIQKSNVSVQLITEKKVEQNNKPNENNSSNSNSGNQSSSNTNNNNTNSSNHPSNQNTQQPAASAPSANQDRSN